MSRSTTGWSFVAAQAVLLIALVLLPGSDDWPTPTWLLLLSWLLSIGGFVLVLVAAGRLGSALTPTPVPTEHGELATTGLYGYMRHPIYTGVLAIVFGIVLRSGNLAHLAVGAVTVGFFTVKARWEEARLAEHYADYQEYAARTPRFLPRPPR